MRCQLIFFLLFLFCHSQAIEKVVLWGQVRDAEGRPIEQAVVGIPNTPLGTVTDSEGNYQLPLTPGQHRIAVSSLGFMPYQTDITISSSSQLNITLNPDNVKIETIDIQAKGKSQQMRETVFAINALDIKPLVNTHTNLAEMIGYSTGINIRSEGGIGSNFDLSINGLSGNAIRYFIDGIPMQTMGSGINLTNIPISLINRIEVYKGVIPVQLGTDALGGAINIITKKLANNHLDWSYSHGSFNTHQANLNAQYKMGKKSILIRPILSFNHSDNNYKMHNVEIWNPTIKEFQNRTAKRFHDAYTMWMGRVEAGVTDRWWTDDFFVSATIFQDDKELQTGSRQNVVYGQAHRNSESTGLSVTYKKKNFLTKNLSIDLAYAHTWDHQKVVDTTFRKYNWDGSYINSSRNEINGRAKSLRHSRQPLNFVKIGINYLWHEKNNLTLNYSLNSLHNRQTDETDAEFVPSNDRFDKHITGLSYNREWLGKQLSHLLFVKHYASYLSVEQQELEWITGAKEVAGSITTNHWGGGTGLRYHFAEYLAFKTSVEKSVRLPLAREVLGNSTTVYPNYLLKPESSLNVNLGVSGALPFKPGQRFNYEINGFIRRVKDYIRLKVSETDGMSQYQNVNDVTIKGVESDMRYHVGKSLDLSANVSYLHEINKTRYQDDGKPEITYNNRIPNRPWLYANLSTKYTFSNPFNAQNSRLTLRYSLRYVHWFYLTWEGYGALASKSTIPTQWVSNLTANYSWQNERYNLSLNCNNLFDQIVYDKYKLQKPGRAFYIKFRFFINSK
ncbi:MAG: TonB-dependent receptor plug domain-containing protein [Breznakibacter sp.]